MLKKFNTVPIPIGCPKNISSNTINIPNVILACPIVTPIVFDIPWCKTSQGADPKSA